MKIEIADAQSLSERTALTLEELVELSGLSSELLIKLVEYGALAPVEAQHEARPAQWRFSSECVVAVRTVSRLRGDFDLDANALSVALMLVERIHELEARLQELQCQFPQARKWTRS